jgi:hypothetical protein
MSKRCRRLRPSDHRTGQPLLAGAGERLFDNVADALRNYHVTEMVSSPAATHVRLNRR